MRRPQTEREWLEGDFEDELIDDLDDYLDGTMVDLGGGMIVPLREILDDDYEL